MGSLPRSTEVRRAKGIDDRQRCVDIRRFQRVGAIRGGPLPAVCFGDSAPIDVIGLQATVPPPLPGQQIGVTARGSGAEFQFLDLLKGAGLNASDVTLKARARRTCWRRQARARC